MGCIHSTTDYELSSANVEEVKNAKTSSRRKSKVYSDYNVHKTIADSNLRAALTHPTILKYFREYCQSQDAEALLDFYLQAEDVIDRFKAKDVASSIEMFESLARRFLVSSQKVESKYDLEHNSLVLRIKPHFVSVIMSYVNQDGSVDSSKFHLVVEGLKLAQQHNFFTLKEVYWLSFCQSNLYHSMMKRKEVRTTISLYSFGDNCGPKGVCEKFTGINVQSEKSVRSQAPNTARTQSTTVPNTPRSLI